MKKDYIQQVFQIHFARAFLSVHRQERNHDYKKVSFEKLEWPYQYHENSQQI